jgi:hypothetical protein
MLPLRKSLHAELGFIVCSSSFYEMRPASIRIHHSHKIRFRQHDQPSRRFRSTVAESNPKRPIERAILNRFAHVLRRDVDLVVQIGDGA